MTVTTDYTPIPTVRKVFPTFKEAMKAAQKNGPQYMSVPEAEALGFEVRERDKDQPNQTVGRQTLADLPFGPPPEPLVPPFLTPNGPTILYGPGGVGKGMMSVYFAMRLVRNGIRVMVLDYEYHEQEWSNRARSMGFTEDELRQVQYRAPFGPEWTAPRGPLQEIADLVREDCDLHGVGYLIIDSYTASTSNGDAMGGAAAAQEFFIGGVARVGRPTMVIAHVAGASNRWPDRPFGSVFVHNFARETWAVEKVTDDEDYPDIEEWRLQPRVMTLELRNKKLSVGTQSKPQFISFSFHINGETSVSTETPKGKSHEAIIADLLSRAEKPMSVKDIASAIKAETGDPITDARIRAVFSRSKRFASTKEVPKRWTLAKETNDAHK